MSRRKSTLKQHCFQMLALVVFLYGTAVLLHVAMHLLFTYAFGRR